MVAVPVTTRRSVEVQPLGNGRLRYAAPRNLVGPAVERFGQAMGKAADDMDRIEAVYDQADVLNLDNMLASEASAAQDEFSNLRGDQPGRALQDRLTRLDARAKELVGGARSERARNMAQRALSVRIQNARDKMTAHADDEMFRFRDAALVGGRDQAVIDAIGAAGTPQFDVAIGTGLTRIEERATLLGAPPEVAQLERGRFLDEVHGGVLDQKFAAPDPDIDDVLAYLDTHGEAMTPKLKNETMERLQRPLQGRVARSDADAGFVGISPTVGSAPGASSAGGSAVELIRGFEGFRETTYWDVNHHRTGYGSDTITGTDGSVRQVKQGDQVSREDAERDLARRVSEIEDVAAKRAGQGWRQLSGGARAAVVSVAYNYGADSSRLRPLWEAASRGDAAAVAGVIEGFAGDNGGVNKRRREQEALAARTGESGYSNAPRQWDRAQVYANLDAAADREGWNPERKERARVETDKRIERDEGLLNEQQNEAAETAAAISIEKGDGFRVSMIPRDVWNAMSSLDQVKLKDTERELTKPKPVEAGGAAYQTLRVMQRLEPEKFKGVDVLSFAGKVTNGELMDMWLKQQDAIRKPPPVFQPQSAISEAINRGKKYHGIEVKDGDLPEIYDTMAAVLQTTFEKNGRIGPNDADEALRTATGLHHTEDGWFSDTKVRGFEVEYEDIPAPWRTQFERNWQGRGSPTPEQVLTAYRRLLRPKR